MSGLVIYSRLTLLPATTGPAGSLRPLLIPKSAVWLQKGVGRLSIRHHGPRLLFLQVRLPRAQAWIYRNLTVYTTLFPLHKEFTSECRAKTNAQAPSCLQGPSSSSPPRPGIRQSDLTCVTPPGPPLPEVLLYGAHTFLRLLLRHSYSPCRNYDTPEGVVRPRLENSPQNIMLD